MRRLTRAAAAAARRVPVLVLVLGATALHGLAAPVLALAATPSPAPGGDPRSPGQGPGLVGDPAFAIVGVLVIAAAAVVVTVVYVRLTGGPGTDRDAEPGSRRG